jgi:hypothetical protein
LPTASLLPNNGAATATTVTIAASKTRRIAVHICSTSSASKELRSFRGGGSS